MADARLLCILAFFALAPRARRVEAATLLYIVLLSYVLPLFLAGIGIRAAAQAVMPCGHGQLAGGGRARGARGDRWRRCVAWRWRRSFYN